jgi:hypothetical protein
LECGGEKATKEEKRHNWATKGDHVAPIVVPPTPNGELACSLREKANYEIEAGLKLLKLEVKRLRASCQSFSFQTYSFPAS